MIKFMKHFFENTLGWLKFRGPTNQEIPIREGVGAWKISKLKSMFCFEIIKLVLLQKPFFIDIM